MDLVEKIRQSEKQKIATMCYLIKDDREVLLLHRVKEPFKGFLVPPGGKKEAGEDIFQCIKREMYEETGFLIEDPQIRVVTSEIGPENYNWILFIFTCKDFSGEMKESNEGKLSWVELNSIEKQNLSQIDKLMLPYVFEDKQYIMYLKYDEDKICTIEKIEEVTL